MPEPTPPIAAKKPHKSTNHGFSREDPYHWLRAANWQEVMRNPDVLDPDIRAYLDAENEYFSEAFNEKTKDLQEKIYREIRGRIKEDDSGVPSPDGDFAYFSRMETGGQYPILVRTLRNGGDEQVLLDCNVEAGEGYFGFAGARHDPAHQYLAWAADRNGSEYYTIKVRDLKSGRDLEDIIEKSAGGAVWSADSKSLYYTELDENHRPFRVRRHAIGTGQSEDEIIYEEKDSGFFVGVDKTLSGKFIVINAHDHQTSEIRLIDSQEGGAPFLVAQRKTGREYDVDEREGTLFILTNDSGAEDFKIVTADISSPGAKNWQDIVPHRPGTLILASFVIRNHLVRLERAEGLPRIIVRNLSNDSESEIAFEEEAYSLGVSAGYEFDTSDIRFTYSSPTTPSRVFDYDLETGARTLRKEQEVPSGHNPKDYITRRIFAEATDGEKIPLTLLYHKDTRLDGSAPCLLYGYGAYGISLPANFSVANLSLVDRGFVHAIAHVRGGKDKGYNWYAQGRREHKTNTFSDFISSAEHLIAEDFTSKGKIVAQGGSAGGMLMGAVANMRADLFAGVIAQVPFVDVLTTMLDDTLPLTPPEWPEWGNPIASKEDFDRIRSYSPYDNVQAQYYAPMLVLAGLTDPRVTYWEPAKWVARLRASKTDDNPLFLKTNMEAGHGGATGRFERIKETALTQAFALWAANNKNFEGLD
ncbi:MAG TPA: S9 family peptidase [Devosia sp.]|nr:S9 family peptidase [Devosia sp.]